MYRKYTPQVILFIALISSLLSQCNDDPAPQTVLSNNDPAPQASLKYTPELFRPSELWMSPCNTSDRNVCWENIKRENGITEDQDGLHTSNGKFYPVRRNVSELQKQLEFHLKNPDLARVISSAYADLAPRLSKEQQQAFISLLVGEANYSRIGFAKAISSSYVDIKPKITSIIHQEYPILVPILDIVFSFIDQITKTSTKRPKEEEEKSRVLVLTTHAGGGHYPPAESFANYINSNQEILHATARLVVIERDLPTHDSFIHFGGMHHFNIYDEMFQKRRDPIKSNCYWGLSEHLEKNYLPNSTIKALQDIAISEEATMVVSFMFFYPEAINIGYALGIPTYIAATDFKLLDPLTSNIQMLNPLLAHILSPIADSHFMNFTDRAGPLREEREIIHDFVSGRIATFSQFQSKLPVFDQLGFPVRSAIEKAHDRTDQEKNEIKQTVRDHLGVRREAQMVIVTIGAAGDKAIDTVVDALQEQDKVADGSPIDFFILAGRNTALKEALEKKVEGRMGNFKFNVLSFQTPEAMADLYTAADLLITKPGGSTTAEVLSLGVKTLVIGYYPWEKGNFEFLQKNKIATENTEIHHLVSDILTAFKQPEPERYTLPDWRKNSRRLIAQARSHYDQLHND